MLSVLKRIERDHGHFIDPLNDRDAHFTDQSSMGGMVNPSFRDTWTDEYGINRHFNPNQCVGSLEDQFLSRMGQNFNNFDVADHLMLQKLHKECLQQQQQAERLQQQQQAERLHHHHHHHKFPHHHFSLFSINYSSSQFRSSSHSSSSQSTTLMDIFKAIAKQEVAAHGSVSIRDDQKSYSYNQLISLAQKLSNLLCENDVKGNLGGARIGIVAKPSAEFVAGILVTWFSGGVVVPLALSYPEVELLYVMNNSDVSAILKIISSEKSNNGHSKNGESDADRIFLENIERSSEDPTLILYTSGTTGKLKGVVHTHRSILAQVQALTKAWEYTSADRFLHCLPLHHVHGLFNGLFAPLYVGSTVEFLPKFSVSGIWKRWRESYPTEGYEADDAITVFTGVPTMYT
ncbi:hypothetical protein KIW84_020417 [Lathyrus oleraceus]|uniref:AMP-dependent synthetase/ligase domain-containing protein n=1 Tax=Pisum sativum TaxID=3888 RepID=A0A9D4Y511_PEA|nr:hypothetical protein KIW84_020417 [Pisum sativum]